MVVVVVEVGVDAGAATCSASILLKLVRFWLCVANDGCVLFLLFEFLCWYPCKTKITVILGWFFNENFN